MTFLHPIVVHFPIALLTVYALLELVQFKRFTALVWWQKVKSTLLFLGTLGALAAYGTGSEFEGSGLVEMHAAFALFTVWFFLFLSLVHAAEWRMPNKYSGLLMRPYIIVPLALIGLGLVTITGGLGGAIVYGTDFDPFMGPIFKLLGVY